MATAAILDNFEWPYLRNGSRCTYIARIARSIFAIAQLSCMSLLLSVVYGPYGDDDDLVDVANCVADCRKKHVTTI